MSYIASLRKTSGLLNQDAQSTNTKDTHSGWPSAACAFKKTDYIPCTILIAVCKESYWIMETQKLQLSPTIPISCELLLTASVPLPIDYVSFQLESGPSGISYGL